jgi:hypothetical protein
VHLTPKSLRRLRIKLLEKEIAGVDLGDHCVLQKDRIATGYAEIPPVVEVPSALLADTGTIDNVA